MPKESIYIDCVITCPSDAVLPKDCIFNQTLTNPLLGKASDYKLIIESFNIDRVYTPLFTYNNDWVISFGLDSLIVPFIARDTPLTSAYPGNTVYSIYQMQAMINETLSTLHISVGNIGDPPFLNYDSGPSLWSFYIPQVYPSTIYFNSILYDLFLGLDRFFASTATPRQFAILNNSTPLNSVVIGATTYNRQLSSFSTDFTLPDVIGIVITSSSLPARDGQLAVDTVSSEIKNSILQTFFTITQEEPLSLDPFQYTSPQMKYEIDLLSNSDLRQITFEINLLRRDGSITRHKLIAGERASVKLLFRKN